MNRVHAEDVTVEELDGVARGYMEISDGSYVIRMVYKTIAYKGRDREQVQDAMDAALDIVRAELRKIGDSIIWWRRRPEITEQLDIETGDHFWQGYARLDTTPHLPPETWDKIFANPPGARSIDLREQLDAAALLKPAATLADYEVTG